MAEWQRGWRGMIYHTNVNSPYPPEYSKIQLSATYGKPSPPKPRKVHRMIASQVHWCEYGGTDNGHPFSSKDPNKERIVRSKETDKRDGYGNQIVEDEEFYLCGKHANGLFRSGAETSAKEIPPTVQD